MRSRGCSAGTGRRTSSGSTRSPRSAGISARRLHRSLPASSALIRGGSGATRARCGRTPCCAASCRRSRGWARRPPSACGAQVSGTGLPASPGTAAALPASPGTSAALRARRAGRTASGRPAGAQGPPMTQRALAKSLPGRPSTAALLGAGLLVLALALIPLSILARQPGYPVQPIVIALSAGVVGTLVARHQPRNACGWLLLAIATASLLSTGAGAYSLLVYRLGRQLPLGPAGLVLYQLWSPGLMLFFLVILLFPDGRVPSARWRPALWAYCLLCAGYLGLLIGVAANAIGGNRIHVDAYGGLTVVDYPSGYFAVVQNILLALTLALGLTFACYQMLAWRRATGDRRQQLKWL